MSDKDMVRREAVRLELAPLLELLAYNAYTGHLNGLPKSPACLEHFANPEPGDYVVEISSIENGRRQRGSGFGVLVKVTREGIYTGQGEPFPADEWDGEPEPLDTYWYILLLDGTLFKWHNCRLIRVPEYVVDWVAHPLPGSSGIYEAEARERTRRNRSERLAAALACAEE